MEEQARKLAQHMQVCSTWAGLYGPFTDDWHESIVIRHQKCGCQNRSREQTEPRWPRADFNTAVELCYSCAAEVILSGSRWSVFFCEDCRPRVFALNRSYGLAVIPYGRHSMMNGFGITGEDAKDPQKLATFTEGFNSLFDRIHRLHDWRTNLVRDYLARMGDSGNVSVEKSSHLR
jgi:hypothetical protein